MKLTSLTTTGVLETTTVNSELFTGEANPVLMAQAVRVYRAAARQGTSKTKTRGEISRTKKKWFKQKHTGNARHGARTPNIFVGGGVSHGPNGLQNWALALPQTMKRAALRSALVSQTANVVMVDEFAKDNRTIRQMLKPVVSEKTLTLVVLPEVIEPVIKAIRNMPSVNVVTADRLTLMEVAMADKVVLTPATVAKLETRLLRKKSVLAPVKTAPAVTNQAEVKPAKVAKTKTATKAKPVAKKAAAKPKTTKKTK